MRPDAAKQLPPVMSRLSRYADLATSILVFVRTESDRTTMELRRQGKKGFMGIVLEGETPISLTERSERILPERLSPDSVDTDHAIRTMAISLLGQTKPPSAIYVPKLLELLKRDETLFAALLAVGYYGPSAAPGATRAAY